MRATVLLCDALVFVPAVLYAVAVARRRLGAVSTREQVPPLHGPGATASALAAHPRANRCRRPWSPWGGLRRQCSWLRCCWRHLSSSSTTATFSTRAGEAFGSDASQRADVRGRLA